MNLFIYAFILLTLVFAVMFTLSKKQGHRVVCWIIFVLVVFEAGFIGLRNNFLFETPERAYAVAHFGRGDVQTVLVGDETALIVGLSGNTRLILVIDQVENKWKIGNAAETQAQTICLFSNGTAVLYHKKNTKDYYIEVQILTEGNHMVSDNVGSEFKRVINKDGTEAYYALVQDWQEDYMVTIDGVAKKRLD